MLKRFGGTLTVLWTYTWTLMLIPHHIHTSYNSSIQRICLTYGIVSTHVRRTFFLRDISLTREFTGFFIDKCLLQRVSSSLILDTTWSNHGPISLVIEENGQSSSMYLWWCNSQLLHSPLYQPILLRHLIKFLTANHSSVKAPFTLWNALKVYMKGIFSQLSIRDQCLKNQQINDTLQCIHHLEAQNKAHSNKKNMGSYT